jgi:predicted nucleic acid-binding protein
VSVFVADASATLPWCFEDEATEWSANLLLRLTTGDQIVVPAHWPTEVSNGLLVAIRKQRITLARAETFWNELAILPVTIQAPLSPEQAKFVLRLSVQHGLTFYDGAYLDMAQRMNLPLATLDSALIRAATTSGIALIP